MRGKRARQLRQIAARTGFDVKQLKRAWKRLGPLLWKTEPHLAGISEPKQPNRQVKPIEIEVPPLTPS